MKSSTLFTGGGLLLYLLLIVEAFFAPYYPRTGDLDPVLDLAAGILIVLPPVAILSTWYIWYLRDQSQPHGSVIFGIILTVCMLILLAAFPVAPIALHYLFDRAPVYGSPISLQVIVWSLIITLAAPPVFAIAFWWLRKKRHHGAD